MSMSGEWEIAHGVRVRSGILLMERRKFIKRIEKNLGIKRLKNQINAINLLFVFLVLGAIYAIYLNHSGWWLTYGILVAAASLFALAAFLSYRIKLQVKLSAIKMDYRDYVVKPNAEIYFEDGAFSKRGGLTEREIISTNMFSDTRDYKYTACNELKGKHKNIHFSNSDIFEDCETNNIHLHGRLYSFDISTPNVNPVVFTTASAPILECQNQRIHIIKTDNEVINRMFRVYAFDEKEANNLLTENMTYKLRQIVGLQLGKINKICFHSNKIYIYYTTEVKTYEEFFTKKHDVETELRRIDEQFSVVGKLIDIL